MAAISPQVPKIRGKLLGAKDRRVTAMPVQMANEISGTSRQRCVWFEDGIEAKGEHVPFVLEKEIDAQVLEDKSTDNESAEEETDRS